MSDEILYFIMGGSVAVFVIIAIVYLILRKRMNKSDYKRIQRLQKGTKESRFSLEVLYQKLYLSYIKIPFIKRYLMKLRRRLEIINIDDEYLTRRESSKILTRMLLVIIPVALITIIITHTNTLLMTILLLFELFMLDTLIDRQVDKIDDKMLKEQIEFFSEIRHAYHEYNMVEEAIYQVSQDDERTVSAQGEKIYEILISDDPENELEKYYDVAPNSFLKEFAGISYLTKEFGDRKVDGASLYLKNVNNITQEMQLEILKRDKLNYVFQSLSFIAIAPVLLLEPLRNWAVGNFTFTESWYNGKSGMIVQIVILLLTFICYILVRRLKDNGSTNINTKNTENPWQKKVYGLPIFKKIIDLFLPKQRTKEHRKVSNMLKDAASPLKIEWLYTNRVMLAIVTCLVSIVLFAQLHVVAIDFVYNEPTTDYDLLAGLSEKDKKSAMEVTQMHNKYLDMFRGKINVKEENIENELRKSTDFTDATDEEISKNAEQIYNKLQVVNKEFMQWYEILLALVFAVAGYMFPIWLLFFQVKMRQLEMEDEVMQFQTIILMLMRIERVNVEIILEWLERYANIFKPVITKCVNNYEAGAWEALEEMKNETNYQQFIRIVESLQAAVEKIPIRDAFDELDSERDYYQEKRKESNNRLISRKAMIGKVIGFAPMVSLFVGYLIVPLVFVGFTSMGSSFRDMATRKM
ncbi:MAG: hypothetical protein IKF97_00960 [Clostridia bacterium]|nr:hypothetical protein [Clostridia bacterium]